MSVPYVIPNAPLSCCNPGYRSKTGDGPCHETIGRNECRFTYAHWCHVCKAQVGPKCHRRRSKSEGVDADPLRELNRDYEPEYQRRWLPKECQVGEFCGDACCNYLVQADEAVLDEYPVEVCKAFPRSMEVDCSADHARSFSDRSVFAGKNFGRRKLPSNRCYQQKCQVDSCIDIMHTRHMREHETSRYASIPQTNECITVHQTNQEISNNSNRNIVPFEVQENPSCIDKFSPRKCELRNSTSKHVVIRMQGCVDVKHQKVYRRSSRTGSQQDEDPSIMQKGYLRKTATPHDGADGKRLHQRSESELGVMITGGTNRELCWEPKRPRDISPALWNKEEYQNEQSSWRHTGGHETAKCHIRDTKLPSIPVQRKKPYITLRKNCNRLRDDSLSSDSDFADSDRTAGSAEDGDSKGDPGDDSDEDDQSVMSSFTTVSTDSNTPSLVGETLGSISLDDCRRYEKAVCYGGSSSKSCLPGFLRASLFSHVPPYVQFSTHEEKGVVLPSEIQRLLKWKLSTITPLIVRRTLVNSGFRLVRKSNDWVGTWGKHMKSFCFKTLKDSQKINHFPGTFQIGRKDRLWKNLQRLMAKFGKKEFGFIPHTYILPQDTKTLRQAWERSCGKSRWIIKPPASARGTGIRVVHRWSQIPKKKPLVVQKYIVQPYLINGSKFDLRLYVLVTSINPMRVYIYDDGLVRFASVKYSADMASLGDRYMHLTNYSINKLSSHYTQNEDATSCHGHKWTVKTLWSFLEKGGVDVKSLWSSLVDLVIKTIISGESSIGQMTKANLASRYCSYELFGVDVLLDHELKPWLLEVNISPSLHSSSPLDLAVKGPLVRDLMNIAGFQIPKLSPAQQEEFGAKWGTRDAVCFDRRIYTTLLSQHERMKHLHYMQHSREEYLNVILEDLMPDDIRHLIQSEDELTQAGNFIRIFPTPKTHMYHEFFETPRYYNMMFDAWETKYHKNRHEGIQLLESLCRRKKHLIVPVPGVAVKSSVNQHSVPANETSPVCSFKNSSEQSSAERKAISLSSVMLYRAVRPRSGVKGMVLRPFSRIVHVNRKSKCAGGLSRDARSASSSEGEAEDEENYDDDDTSVCVKC